MTKQVKIDDTLNSRIQDLKNKILNSMRDQTLNLFTISKAWPLVEIDPETNKHQHLTECISSRYNMAERLRDEFKDSGMDL